MFLANTSAQERTVSVQLPTKDVCPLVARTSGIVPQSALRAKEPVAVPGPRQVRNVKEDVRNNKITCPFQNRDP